MEFKEGKKNCVMQKDVMQRAVILSILFCLLFSGCAAGQTEDVSYSEASCQVLMHSPVDSCYRTEDMKIVGEK